MARSAIEKAYRARNTIPPGSQPTLLGAWLHAYDKVASLADICKVATITFIKHYRVDLAALAEVVFGRSVLQRVVTC